MSTTTIRLSESLKKRAATAASNLGSTMHNFILQAIAEKTDQEELKRDFYEVADERYADILKTGKTISWNEMRHYLKSKTKGKTSVARPTARKRAP
jgi:predicted transcriptional regulator